MNFVKTPTQNMDGDEYYLTAHQIFECCGTSTVRVDTLMDKFAPFVKTNKSEFSFLKTLLDPEQCNPEIDVSKLANALHQYREGERKMDLDESFNLRCGQVPQDSDSGISTDGLQMLEDLQCELKEKEHLAQQLRSQLDLADRQNDETVAALVAERDSLKKHLNLLREESASLSHVRREYEECCERLAGSGAALDDARRELDALRRRCARGHDQRAELAAEKQSLQELLSKSKDECHRINDMYAVRQSALLVQNEKLKHEHAELTAKNQDQEEFMTQLIKEKAILEMELKDLLNKSNQTHLRFDRSIDVSYNDDQMLTALDSLNADSRFCSENRVLDEDSFISALREDQGKVTNVSLFDEIRMSMNLSRINLTECTTHLERCFDSSLVTTATQTDDSTTYDKKDCIKSMATQVDGNINKKCIEFIATETQTDQNRSCCDVIKSLMNEGTQTCVSVEDCCTQMDLNKNSLESTTQTNKFIYSGDGNYVISIETQTDKNNGSTAISTQTSGNRPYGDDINSIISIETQNDQSNVDLSLQNKNNIASIATQINVELYEEYKIKMVTVETQTNENQTSPNNKVHVNSVDFQVQTDFVNNDKVIEKTDFEAQTDIQECVPYCGGDNAQTFIDIRTKSDSQVSIRPNYKGTNTNVNVTHKVDAEIQTETAKSGSIVKDNVQFFDAKYNINTATQTVGEFIRKKPKFIKKAQQLLKLQEKEKIVKATVKNDRLTNNNNVDNKCLDCTNKITQTNKLESNVEYSSMLVKEMKDKLSEYENNLSILEAVIGQGTDKNIQLLGLVEDLHTKIEILETACETHREVINNFTSAETCCVQSQTDFVQSSVSTQADVPCPTCQTRVVSHRGLRRFLWEALKCLFQVFAVVCFLGAISVLYGVSQRGRVRCDRARDPTPWRWFDAQDVMDLLLRIEYTAEVPM